MRSFGVLCCVALACNNLWGGEVQDAQGKPVPFARVTVLGRGGWLVTDSQGHFTLPGDVAPPVHLVVTGADGVVLGSFSFPEKLPDPLVLVVAPTVESITVLASRPPDLVMPPATAFATISQQELAAESPSQLVDALATVPNVGRTGYDHAAVPAIRGLAKFRSLMLVDGMRVLSERRAGTSATFLDPLTLGEVEVVRGAAGVAYGSDAFGGVIAARTRLALPGEPWELHYELANGWRTPEASAHFEAGGSVGSGAITLGAAVRNFDDYESPEAEVFNSGADFRSFRLGFQYPLRKGIWRALWRSDWGRDIGRPTIKSRTDRIFYPEENSHRLVVGFEGPLSGRWRRFSWNLGWAEYQLITARDRSGTGSPRSLTHADVSSHDYQARAELEGDLAGGQLTLGLDAYGRTGLRATNTGLTYPGDGAPTRQREVSIDDARKDDLGLFAVYQYRFSVGSVETGLRVDSTHNRNHGGYFGNISTSFTRGSGFLAGRLVLSPGWEASLQFSRGFRDALLSDRFYRGISGRGFITGNPHLKPETSQQWDASIRYWQGPFQAALYAYHYTIFDMIERFKSGKDFFFRNRAEARLKGLELESRLRLPKNLELLAGLQYPEGKVVDDGSYLDDIPARGGFLQLRQRQGRWSWQTHIAAYARDTRPGPTETVVPGFTVVHAMASYQVTPALEVAVQIRNLLDRVYPGDNEPEAVLAPGRSVRVSLRGKL